MTCFSLGIATPVAAQERAEELLWNCSGKAAGNAVEKEARRLHCIGYLQGANDMLRLLNDFLKANLVCAPDEGLSNDQVVRIVMKWIEDNPEKMHIPGRTAVLMALMKAFPCKG